MFDFNSLYPFCFGFIKQSFNRYTDDIIYIPKKVQCHITDKEEMLKTIFEKKELFVIILKVHIPEDKFNCRTPGAVSDPATVLNFPPVYLNIDMVTDEKTIGSKMYKYMKDNSIPYRPP
jgi:hypothetical protein